MKIHNWHVEITRSAEANREENVREVADQARLTTYVEYTERAWQCDSFPVGHLLLAREQVGSMRSAVCKESQSGSS